MLAGAPDDLETDTVRNKSRSRQLAEGLAGGFVSLDADWRISDCNAAAERLFGQGRADLIGRVYCDLAGLGPDSAFAELVEKVAASGRPTEVELRFRTGQRSRLLAVRAFAYEDGVAATWSDVTAARAAQRRLALSDERHREVADGAPTAAWLSRADGRLVFINQAMVDALGHPRRELLGEGWLHWIDPEDRPRLLAARAAARATHGPVRFEGRFRRPGGALRVIEMYGRPRFDARGAFSGHIGVAADVTEARRFEQQRTLLINELNHRVKNTLMTVQSLVRQTLRDHESAKEAERAVAARLMALSAAHNVLNRELWTGADLAEIASELLRPYDFPDRYTIIGPKARLSPKSAIAVAMALQELAAVANRPGAPGADPVRVRLQWRLEGDLAVLEWRERGGPGDAEAALAGFGAVILNRVMAAELGRPADPSFTPEGLARSLPPISSAWPAAVRPRPAARTCGRRRPGPRSP
jgi:PAS domain S-box-containing protein